MIFHVRSLFRSAWTFIQPGAVCAAQCLHTFAHTGTPLRWFALFSPASLPDDILKEATEKRKEWKKARHGRACIIRFECLVLHLPGLTAQ